MAEKLSYSHFTIEQRGAGNLCAIFHKRHPDILMKFGGGHEYSYNDAFNEKSLVTRITNLGAGGCDATFSRQALEALRAAKAALPHPE